MRLITIEEMNFRTFKHGFFLTRFLSVTSRKNQSNSFRRGVVFSLIRLICFSLIESCCFRFVTSQVLRAFKKRQEISILWKFCSSNAHNSNVQSFPEIKYSLPVVRVYASYGNRTHVNSLEGCYATTTPTMLRRFTIEEMNFRTFKHGFFLTHFLSVTSRKNQNNSLRSGVNFSLTRLISSH